MIGAGPNSVLILEVVKERVPLRGVVLLKQIFLENFIKLKTGRRYHVKEMRAAAVFLQYFYDHLRAAETKQFRFNEWVLFLKRMNHRRSISDISGTVVDKSFLFFSLRNDAVAVLCIRADVPEHHQNPNCFDRKCFRPRNRHRFLLVVYRALLEPASPSYLGRGRGAGTREPPKH